MGPFLWGSESFIPSDAPSSSPIDRFIFTIDPSIPPIDRFMRAIDPLIPPIDRFMGTIDPFLRNGLQGMEMDSLASANDKSTRGNRKF